MRHRIVFSLGRRQRNGFLLYSGPGDKAVQKIETVTRDTLPIRLVRGPISVGHHTIADKTTDGRGNDTPIEVEFQSQIKGASKVAKNAFTGNKMSTSGTSVELTQGHGGIRDIRTRRDSQINQGTNKFLKKRLNIIVLDIRKSSLGRREKVGFDDHRSGRSRTVRQVPNAKKFDAIGALGQPKLPARAITSDTNAKI